MNNGSLFTREEMCISINPLIQKPTVLWDFDGTLTKTTLFSESMLRVLKKYYPKYEIDISEMKPYLQNVFPWHFPEMPHLDLTTPELWWHPIEKAIFEAYISVGVAWDDAQIMSAYIHLDYIDPNNFILYEDAFEVLDHFKKMGWNNIVLSNHVPELPAIAEQIGLAKVVDLCITSASIGYEKPNINAFRIALEAANNPKTVWMVGDSVKADIMGGQKAGIKTLLVHNQNHEEGIDSVNTLSEVIDFIVGKV